MQDAPSIYRVPPPPPPPPGYRLFTTGQVTAAAILLSPVVGGILVALNRKRVGRQRDAAIALAMGVALTVLTIVVGIAVRPGGFIAIAGALAVRGLAQRDQPLLDAHLAAGGKRGSWLTALGLPLLIIGIVLGGGAVLVERVGSLGDPSIEVGPRQHVRYGAGATEADARTTADELKREGVLAAGPADVTVRRRGASVVVGIVVRDGAWNDPEQIAIFGRIRDRLAARAFPGKDVELTLLDDAFDAQKTLTGPALARLEVRANQTITYETAVGSLEAERLRDALVADGFFADDGKGRDVKLARAGEAEVVSFVLGAGRWDEPSIIEAFETLRTSLAGHGIGNGKLRVDLCDDTFQTKRTLGAK